VVQIDVEARGFRAEDNGTEREVPMDDRVDVRTHFHLSEGTSRIMLVCPSP